MNKHKNKIDKGFIIFTLYSILIIIISSFIISVITGDKNNDYFGYTVRIVVTGSMEPEIKVNSISIIKLCDIDEIAVNDIVCFNYNQDIIHRVTEKTTNDNGDMILHTKGDANVLPDSIEINSGMVIGKVVKTFNGISELINKYSISPGNFDITLFSRELILYGLMVGVIIWLSSYILAFISIIVKSFSKKENFDAKIQYYIDDIDELILYKEILKELNSTEHDNKTEYIANKVAKAKAIIELKNMHEYIKDYKKSIKRCVLINKVVKKLKTEASKNSIN